MKELRERWHIYFLELIILVLFGWMITEELKPETEIFVSCEIKEGLNANYNLDISFNNKADHAGKNFYIYVWGVNSSSWGSDYIFSESCELIRKESVDRKSRLKVFCESIPPNSVFDFSVDSNLNEEIITSKKILMEWWGETTPYKKEYVFCS